MKQTTDYRPQKDTEVLLDKAWEWVQSVPYDVTARWLFYRLYDDGILSTKDDYKKRFLPALRQARKRFYKQWRPWTLVDDTRAAILIQRQGYYGLHIRGNGFRSEAEWRETLEKQLTCPLDRWVDQPIYCEVWFEAAAMQAQFLYYANENIPLFSFHGDCSIYGKWEAATRLANHWLEYQKPIIIYYFGDCDAKGRLIPQSAWADVKLWATAILMDKGVTGEDYSAIFQLKPIGLTPEQAVAFGLAQNPDHPGQYQWEALSDSEAAELIGQANENLNLEAFGKIKDSEKVATATFWGQKLDG